MYEVCTRQSPRSSRHFSCPPRPAKMLAMSHQLNRRTFIIASGFTALASTRVLGANDTLRIGVIGAGGRMNDLLTAADKVPNYNYQIVAVSDVYSHRRRSHSRRQPRPHSAGPYLLVAELSRLYIAAVQARRHAGP